MDLERVNAFKREINFKNPELLSQYGVSVQKNLSLISGQILRDVSNSLAARVGSLLNELMLTVKAIDIETLSGPGLIARVWHKFLKEVSLSEGNLEKIKSQIDGLVQRLEESKAVLLEENKKLEQAYEQHLSYYQDLEALIRAGEEAIMEEWEVTQASPDAEDYLIIQTQKDSRYVLLEFENRVTELKLTQTMALQTLPLFRLIQRDNTELVNQIQTNILNTIPLWKNQIVF